jgi:EAL domain-containing protein (putative c-di-GMP-specific phosphodiesterase class I)
MDQEGYHNGPLYNYLYFIWGFYILMSFISIFVYKKNVIKKREFEILIGCNIILTIGLIARYVFPSLLLMVIFILVAFIVIFLGFENPDHYLEERALVYNKPALRDYLMELLGKESINAFVLCDKGISDRLELYGIKQTYQGINLVQEYLKREFPDYLVFNYGTGRFVLCSRKKYTPDWDNLYIKLSERFMKPWVSNDTEIFFDLGTSLIDIDARDLTFEVLARVLDAAFARAESGDESTIQVIDNSYIGKIKEETEIKRALEHAIENNKVEVFLQPIVESKSGRIAGAEALARIRNSEGNLIPPGLFIPIAEKNGKINKLGKQVFKKCCQYINSSEFNSLNLSFINVNLSPIQFMSMDLERTLNEYIEDTCADRDCIHLEITEEAMVDEQMMDKQITALTSSGFKFVLDDYGKGYSNMSRLRKTPFINIKLDMSLVWDYCSTPNHILPSEVDAFKKSGFEITAEGIEDEDMANKMRDIGCTYLQGYYFSKPLPFEEFVQKYKAN